MDAWFTSTVFAGSGQLLVTLLVLFGAQLVYALFGFGSGLLAVALLAFVFRDLGAVVSLLLLVNLPTELFVVGRDVRLVPLRELGILLLGIAVGVPVGGWILRVGGAAGWLFSLLGASLLGFALFFWFDQARPRATRAAHPAAPATAGACSGLLAGMFGTGGPPLILYLRLRGLDKRVFRATLMSLFLVTSVVRVPTYVATGVVGWETVTSALLVLPVCLLGLAAGHRLHVEVDERTFRRGVALLLAVLGVLLLARG
jgi:hypothetical protein